ncbi:CLUMA_CG001777, isoform A [Clunio marinus]|uniref:CLUMA_CG001777, isoform A n=1 Tax=Clunio marinus TaxID=568069 RepID=A0A1J1HIX8_9DIPT|nr:CLUMA_CG001777, isoform A [Clunio marinus]
MDFHSLIHLQSILKGSNCEQTCSVLWIGAEEYLQTGMLLTIKRRIKRIRLISKTTLKINFKVRSQNHAMFAGKFYDPRQTLELIQTFCLSSFLD